MSHLPPPDPRQARPPGTSGGPVPTPSPRGRGPRPAKAPRTPRAAKAPKANTRSTVRVVSSYRRLALAAVVAIVLVVIYAKYTASTGTYEAVYSQDMVAGATLANGSTATSAQSHVITAAKVSTAMVSPGAFTDSSAAGAIAKAEAAIPSTYLTAGVIPKGTPVLSSQFYQALIPLKKLGANQLVSLDSSVDNAVGGSLQVGDYVDVYVVATNSVNTQTGVVTPAILVASRIQIVAIHAATSQYGNIASQQVANRTLNPTDVLPTNPVPSIYILAANPHVAAEIAAAQGSASAFYLSYVAP